MPQNKSRVKRLLLLAGMIVLLLLCGFIFIPRQYQGPAYIPVPGTRYWQLPTGSRIAYLQLPGRVPRKPYPVIFLQGGPGGFFGKQTEAMLAPLTEDGYDVYLYDQVGSGGSSRLDNIRAYTAERHRQDLEAVIRQTGAEKVILIGQSWGAILATLFLATAPDKVDRLILTCPGPVPPAAAACRALPAPDSLRLRAPLFSNRMANEAAMHIRIRAMRFAALQFGIRLASDAEADAFQTSLNTGLRRSTVCDTSRLPTPTGGSGFYVQVMTMASLSSIRDPRPLLQQYTRPVLVLKGQCDNQPWGVTREYLDLFPNSHFLLIPDAGHSIALEQPLLYQQAIRAFLAEPSE